MHIMESNMAVNNNTNPNYGKVSATLKNNSIYEIIKLVLSDLEFRVG